MQLRVVIVSLAVCSCSSTIQPSDYTSSCTTDADCVPVTFGDVCEAFCNPNGAIRQSEKARYQAEYTKKRNRCPEVTYVRDPCEGERKPIVAKCSSNRCTTIELPDAGSLRR